VDGCADIVRTGLRRPGTEKTRFAGLQKQTVGVPQKAEGMPGPRMELCIQGADALQKVTGRIIPVGSLPVGRQYRRDVEMVLGKNLGEKGGRLFRVPVKR